MLEKIKQVFDDIKSAIVEKGGTVGECDSPTTYANKILNLSPGSGSGMVMIPAFKASATKPETPTTPITSEMPIQYPDGWSAPDNLYGTIWMTYTIVGQSHVYVPWTEPVAVSTVSRDEIIDSSRTFQIYLEVDTLSATISIPTGGTWDVRNNRLVGPIKSIKRIEGSQTEVEWSTSYNHTSGSYTYISMGTFSSAGTIIDSWSDPICINAASDGKDGKDGKDGVDGSNGADGNGLEFVFKRCKNMAEFEALEPPTTNWEQEGWTGDPEGIDGSNYQIEAFSQRKYNGVLQEWSSFSSPTIWSMWGESGIDGSSVEYIFRTTMNEEVTIENGTYQLKSQYWPPQSESDYLTNKGTTSKTDTELLEYFQQPEFVPGSDAALYGWDRGWTDELPTLSQDYPYVFCAIRRYDGDTWSYFSEPALWAKNSIDNVRLDLDNENDSMLYDAEGNLLSGNAVTNATLYDGAAAVTTGVRFSIEIPPSGWTAGIKNNTVTVSNITSDGFITVVAEYKGTQYKKKFSLKKIVGSVKYELAVSPNAISYNKTTGIKSAIIITVNIYRTAQNTDGTVSRTKVRELPQGYVFKVDGVAQTYTSDYEINVDFTKSSHVISLYNGTAFVDEETVPINTNESGATTAFAFTRSFNDDLASASTQVSGGTFENPIPTTTKINGQTVQITWYDSVPSGDATMPVWMTSKTFGLSGNESQYWNTPKKMSDSETMQVEYSASEFTTIPELPNLNGYKDPTQPYGVNIAGWRTYCEDNDKGTWGDTITDPIYMATCYKSGNTWTDWTVSKIKGEEVNYQEIWTHIASLEVNKLRTVKENGLSINIEGGTFQITYNGIPRFIIAIDDAGNPVFRIMDADGETALFDLGKNGLVDLNQEVTSYQWWETIPLRNMDGLFSSSATNPFTIPSTTTVYIYHAGYHKQGGSIQYQDPVTEEFDQPDKPSKDSHYLNSNVYSSAGNIQDGWYYLGTTLPNRDYQDMLGYEFYTFELVHIESGEQTATQQIQVRYNGQYGTLHTLRNGDQVYYNTL